MNGLITIIPVLIGASLLGMLGALVAIPVADALQTVAQELWRERRRRLESQLLDPNAEVLTSVLGNQGR